MCCREIQKHPEATSSELENISDREYLGTLLITNYFIMLHVHPFFGSHYPILSHTVPYCPTLESKTPNRAVKWAGASKKTTPPAWRKHAKTPGICPKGRGLEGKEGHRDLSSSTGFDPAAGYTCSGFRRFHPVAQRCPQRKWYKDNKCYTNTKL